MKTTLLLAFAAAAAAQTGGRAPLTPEQLAAQQAQQKATQEDRQKVLDQLGIKSLRPGRNGSNPQAENFANYDESKANPYPPTLIDGDVAFRQHSAGHTPGPNWPVFLQFAERYLSHAQ